MVVQMFPSSWVLEFKNVHSLFQGKVDLSPISYMCETASHLINTEMKQNRKFPLEMNRWGK